MHGNTYRDENRMTEPEDQYASVKDRAKKKLERYMGPLLLNALHDPKTVELMLNADGKACECSVPPLSRIQPPFPLLRRIRASFVTASS